MLDKLELLLALARERHFGRAAESMGVTQPTLSSAVKSLEEQFGVVIAERGSRFHGFTPEGERILEWARRLVSDARAMRQDVEAMRRSLSGHIRMSVIPTALPFITELTGPMESKYPGIRYSVYSKTHEAVLSDLDNLEVDVGITYVDGQLAARYAIEPLYHEQYSLLVFHEDSWAARREVTWAEAGSRNLCLLTPDMQNRRIVEQHLKEAGAFPVPTVESNSTMVLYGHVRTGKWATILPARLIESLDLPGVFRAIPITAPSVSHAIGLVMIRRDPQTPTVAALIAEARRFMGR